MGTEERFGDLEESRMEIVHTEYSQMENTEVEDSYHIEEPHFNVSHGQEFQVDVSQGEEGEGGDGEEGEDQSGELQQMEQVLLPV